MFECLILVPLRPTPYDRISGDSGVVHGPAQGAPPAVPKGPNPTPAEHNIEHRYIGSRDGTGAAALPFARSVGRGGPRWGDLPMRGNTGCFCPLASVDAASAAWVVIGAGAGVGSGGYGCPPHRPLLRLYSRLCAARAHPCSPRVFVSRPCRAAQQDRTLVRTPWPQAQCPRPSSVRSAKLAPQGVLFLRLAPLSGGRPSASQQTKPEGSQPTPCAEGTGGRAAPRGATIDAQRMAAYTLQIHHDYPYNHDAI